MGVVAVGAGEEKGDYYVKYKIWLYDEQDRWIQYEQPLGKLAEAKAKAQEVSAFYDAGVVVMSISPAGTGRKIVAEYDSGRPVN